MKHYWEITSRYLKQNKKRTMFTIFGVALTVLLLYAGLNLAYGYLLQQRQDGNYAGVLILAVLLIAYIFAVFVRNNLCTGSESGIKESKIVFYSLIK